MLLLFDLDNIAYMNKKALNQLSVAYSCDIILVQLFKRIPSLLEIFFSYLKILLNH